MSRRRGMTAAIAVPAAALAGMAIAATGTAGEWDGADARAARTVGVSVVDDAFRPRRLTVAPGTRVRWTWRGRDDHNVTVTSGPRRFASPTKSSGRFVRTLRRRGTYRIVCTLHEPSMAMRIRVR